MTSKSIPLTFIKSLNIYYNKDTGLVFKSQKEKVVIGRLNEKKEFIDFDDKTLELCDEHGFEPDPSKIEVENMEEKNEKVETPQESSEKVIEDVKESELIDFVKTVFPKPEIKVSVSSKEESEIKPILLSIETLVNEKDKKISQLETLLKLSQVEINELKIKLSKYSDILNNLKLV